MVSWAGEHQEDALTLTTIVLCIFSCACCIYVCISIKISGIYPFSICSKSCIYLYTCCIDSVSSNDSLEDEFTASKLILNPDVSSDIIFWMCVTDFFHCIQIITTQMPMLLQVSYWGTLGCKIISAFAQFLTTQWICWHVTLALTLGVLLISVNTSIAIQILSKYKCMVYIIVFLIPLGATAIPMPFGLNEYGEIGAGTAWYAECWIPEREWLLIYIITIGCSLSLHFIVDLLAIYKWMNVENSNSHYYERIRVVVIKLSRFVIAFTIIRIFSVAFRFWQYLIYPSTPPFWIVMLHYIGLSSVGIANGIVWIWNQQTKPRMQNEINEQLIEPHDGIAYNNNFHVKNQRATIRLKNPNNSSYDQDSDRGSIPGKLSGFSGTNSSIN